MTSNLEVLDENGNLKQHTSKVIVSSVYHHMAKNFFISFLLASRYNVKTMRLHEYIELGRVYTYFSSRVYATDLIF